MDRIQSVFARRDHKALIAYVTVGYPDVATTIEIVPLLASLGCDIIELGIPFSDPLADGATIQEASYHALSNGVTPESCLEAACLIRTKTEAPLVLMGYYNPILHLGSGLFCRRCQECGVDGLIIPDLPPEEAGELEVCASSAGLKLIYLLAPNSSDERIRIVARQSQGFIYLVSVTGVTGAREKLPAELETFVARVRRHTDKPLCVGFGVSTVDQARRVARIADGVIVGSRLVQLLGQRSVTALRGFVTGLRNGLDSPGL